MITKEWQMISTIITPHTIGTYMYMLANRKYQTSQCLWYSVSSINHNMFLLQEKRRQEPINRSKVIKTTLTANHWHPH